MADSITFKDAPSSASSDGYELNRSFQLEIKPSNLYFFIKNHNIKAFKFKSYHLIVFSGSSDDLCYEIGTAFDVGSGGDSPQSPISPRAGQRVKRERTFSLSKSAKSVTKTDTVLRTRQRTIYTAGRPPWYDTQGQSIDCFIIG